jgi:small subunit ribosomal protein S9
MAKKNVVAVGKKKNAVARASFSKGSGNFCINSIPLDQWGSRVSRAVVLEPLMLANKVSKAVDIDISSFGGGLMGQAVAARVAVARGLVEWSGDESVRKLLMEYDDKILSGDPRQKETCKPNDSSARSRRQKSYR